MSIDTIKSVDQFTNNGKFSSYSSRSRGVAVLIKNSFEFKINNAILDTNRNFVILDITIQDYRLTLVAICVSVKSVISQRSLQIKIQITSLSFQLIPYILQTLLLLII
jgi:hypothetical protein